MGEALNPSANEGEVEKWRGYAFLPHSGNMSQNDGAKGELGELTCQSLIMKYLCPLDCCSLCVYLLRLPLGGEKMDVNVRALMLPFILN